MFILRSTNFGLVSDGLLIQSNTGSYAPSTIALGPLANQQDYFSWLNGVGILLSGSGEFRMGAVPTGSDSYISFEDKLDNGQFSLDIKTGILNWKQNINSTLTPTLVDNLVFTITMEGFLVVIDRRQGNIIRITDIFKKFKKKKRLKIKPVGFILGSKNIYLTTSHGRLMIIDVTLGRTMSMLKIDNDKISRPFVLNQNLYIIKENSIIRLN